MLDVETENLVETCRESLVGTVLRRYLDEDEITDRHLHMNMNTFASPTASLDCAHPNICRISCRSRIITQKLVKSAIAKSFAISFCERSSLGL